MDNEHSRSYESLNGLVRAVESAGLEFGITVWIAGIEIDGILTPWYRYAAWLREVTGDSVPPEIAKAACEGWDRRSATGFPVATVANEFPARFYQFALRDVEVRRGASSRHRRLPFLVCHTAAVDAYMPGGGPQERS